MLYRVINILFFIVFLNCNIIQGQTNNEINMGTCQNPYQIKDSVITINLESTPKDKIWFTFTSYKRDIYIQITDADNQPCNYLIFKNTGNSFCEEIDHKTLIPERNKVCDKTIHYDASTSLSYENINRGVCKCEGCCLSLTKFFSIPGERYTIIVYNPGKSINISLSNYKTVTSALISKIETLSKENSINLNTNIEDIKVGQNITIENIYFEGGSANILHSSSNALVGLFAFLDKNKSVKIEIQGHVNGPNEPLDINYSNNLGYRRARAVYDYLIEKKIDKDRLTYKGYGNTMMIYPNAISESEMAKNRRVEILILSK